MNKRLIAIAMAIAHNLLSISYYFMNYFKSQVWFLLGIAQKVLSILDDFKNDGVEVIKLDSTDDEIINSFTDGLNEIRLINKGELASRSAQEFLDEL